MFTVGLHTAVQCCLLSRSLYPESSHFLMTFFIRIAQPPRIDTLTGQLRELKAMKSCEFLKTSCPECLYNCLGLRVSMSSSGTRSTKSSLFFLPHMLQPCEGTQLTFMAEQCSQTDLYPLYLLPNTASFYTWIPAVGFSQGRPRQNVSIHK